MDYAEVERIMSAPDPRVVAAAERFGLDVDELTTHVEGVHGHEPHDDGYELAIARAAECLLGGSC